MSSRSQLYSVASEVLVRMVLLALFVLTEFQEPFFRTIQPEDAYLYRNPPTDSYFPTSSLWMMCFFVPTITICLVYLVNNCIVDAGIALLTSSLTLVLNGIVTNTIKLLVGRPRPDFLYRCWPDGNFPENALKNTLNQDLGCTGDYAKIVDGRKSFPSGHTSFAFATFGFVFFYVSGKLRSFSVSVAQSGQIDSTRLVASIFILLAPVCIAVSRTCDYHHHWQDISVGAVIGFTLAWVVYRHYYPPVTSPACDRPYVMARRRTTSQSQDSGASTSSTEPLLPFRSSRPTKRI